MEPGERKGLLLVIGIVAPCITVLYVILFYALWQYKELVGASLLGVLFLSVAVYLRGRLTEQELRVIRFRHNEETPLDDNGEPLFYREGYHPNPHRR